MFSEQILDDRQDHMLIRNYSSTRGEQAGCAVGGVQVSGARYEI